MKRISIRLNQGLEPALQERIHNQWGWFIKPFEERLKDGSFPDGSCPIERLQEVLFGLEFEEGKVSNLVDIFRALGDLTELEVIEITFEDTDSAPEEGISIRAAGCGY